MPCPPASWNLDRDSADGRAAIPIRPGALHSIEGRCCVAIPSAPTREAGESRLVTLARDVSGRDISALVATIAPRPVFRWSDRREMPRRLRSGLGGVLFEARHQFVDGLRGSCIGTFDAPAEQEGELGREVDAEGTVDDHDQLLGIFPRKLAQVFTLGGGSPRVLFSLVVFEAERQLVATMVWFRSSGSWSLCSWSEDGGSSISGSSRGIR